MYPRITVVFSNAQGRAEMYAVLSTRLHAVSLLLYYRDENTPPFIFSLDFFPGKVVEEGSNVLYSLFLWQIKPLFSHLMEAGSSAPAPASEGMYTLRAF